MPVQCSPRVRIRSAVLIASTLVAMSRSAMGQVTLLNSWGSPGSGAGQFNDTANVAVDSAGGKVYVTDEFNDRVEIFTLSGAYLASVGSPGNGDGQFSLPLGVSVNRPGGAYAVADTANSRIQLFTLSGNVLSGIIGSLGSGQGQLSGPAGVAYAPGLVYVADTLNNRLEVFHSDGSFYFSLDHQDGPAMAHPDGVAVDPVSGNVFVADTNNDILQAFTSTGLGLGTIGPSLGSGPGLNLPKALSISSTQRLYLADLSNNRVVVMTESGTFLTSVSVTQPSGVAISDAGMLYVSTGNSVQRYFDPASWSTGSNVFSDGTVGPTSVAAGAGQILGANLNLTSGKGLIAAGTVSVLAGGSIALSGGSLSTNILAPNATGAVFTFSSGTLAAQQINVANGGAFNATAGGSINASVQFTVSNTGSSGNFDGGAQLTTPICAVFGGFLKVGNATINATGPLSFVAPIYVASGAELQLGDANNAVLKAVALQNTGTLDGAGQVQAQLLNQSTGVIFPAGGTSLTFTGAANTSSGTMNFGGGTIHFSQDIISTGTIASSAGGSLVADGGLTNSGDIETSGGAQFYGAVHNATGGLVHTVGVANAYHGMFTNDGTVNCQTGVIAFLGGFTGPKGVGGAGRVTLDQAFSTGPSPESISFGGGVLLVPTSVLHMRLTTATPDRMNITGMATLAGTIYLDQFNGVPPLPGQSFQAMTYGSESGDITISNQTGRSGLRFAKTLTQSSLSLSFSGLAGDANLDGMVNTLDFTALASNFDSITSNWLGGDFNGDSAVNALDFNALAINYGTVTPAPGAIVPEPLVSSAVILLLMSLRRRRFTSSTPSADA